MTYNYLKRKLTQYLKEMEHHLSPGQVGALLDFLQYMNEDNLKSNKPYDIVECNH